MPSLPFSGLGGVDLALGEEGLAVRLVDAEPVVDGDAGLRLDVAQDLREGGWLIKGGIKGVL